MFIIEFSASNINVFILHLKITETVTDTICDLELYTECKMREEPMEFTKMEETIEEFEKLTCTMVPEIENHTKTRPNCHNETKWNCISDWVLNDRGEKVGALDFTSLLHWVFSGTFS